VQSIAERSRRHQPNGIDAQPGSSVGENNV
jgi:hypothetical protein